LSDKKLRTEERELAEKCTWDKKGFITVSMQKHFALMNLIAKKISFVKILILFLKDDKAFF